MPRTARLIVILVALCAALTPTAAKAVTWHNSGDTAFTATSGPTTFGTIGTAGLPCGGIDLTGTVAATPTTAATWSAFSGTLTTTACSFSGIATPVHCTYIFTASTQAGSVTGGTFDETCGVFQFAARICTLEASLAAHYANPSGSGGRFTVTSGTVRATAGVGSCPVTEIVQHQLGFTVASASGGPAPHTGPVITRTA